MAVLELQGTPRTSPRTAHNTLQSRSTAMDVELWRKEVYEYLEQLAGISQFPPDEVFTRLSAWTARLTEMKIRLSNSDLQKNRAFVNRVIEPFIEECERQFRYHSRKQSTQELEARLTGGMT